jgi:ferrous iron transport protein A
MNHSLLELAPGKKAIIERLRGGRAVFSRLITLGFTPGTAITVVRNSNHGPLLVSLRGSQIALGHGEAAHILVSLSDKEISF